MKRPPSQAIVEAADVKREVRSKLANLADAIDRTDDLIASLRGSHVPLQRQGRGPASRSIHAGDTRRFSQ